MRIAIIHPWFLFLGGGERVTEVLASMYPKADVFALFADEKFVPFGIRNRTLVTSFLNSLPAGGRFYRQLMPLYAMAAEAFDLRGYDLVISSDSSVCKGVLVDEYSTHVSYCHTPTRFIWDYYRPFLEKQPTLLKPLFAATAQYLRTWDYQAAQRVHAFAANSKYVQRRILQYYTRQSAVIYPPIDAAKAFIHAEPEQYYLSVGRLTHTKRIDLLIHACNLLRRKLVIAGAGKEEPALKKLAGKTIEFVGRVPDSELPSLYAKCKAFLFAANEDFGMVPLEAQSYGRPVIAFGNGGSLETVIPYGGSAKPTGLLFRHQSVEDVTDAVLQFENVQEHFESNVIRDHALTFDTEVFTGKMRAFVNTTITRRAVIENSSIETTCA